MKHGTPRGPYRHWKQGHRINSIQTRFNIAMGRLSACDRSGDDPTDILLELEALMDPGDFQKLMDKRGTPGNWKLGSYKGFRGTHYGKASPGRVLTGEELEARRLELEARGTLQTPGEKPR